MKLLVHHALVAGWLLVSQLLPAQFTPASSWITAPELRDSVKANTWVAFEKTFNLADVPARVPVSLAADTKYWLWLNDSLVVREGGLKWGPVPGGLYYDTLDLADQLREGTNRLAIAVWYFGKNSFSHQTSPRAGLRLEAPAIRLYSHSSWRAATHPAFAQQTDEPHPNWRLSESNVRFEADRLSSYATFAAPLWGYTVPAGSQAATYPLPDVTRMDARPVGQWKDFGLRGYTDTPHLPLESTGDTLVLTLPYNAQVTPYFNIRTDRAGQKIDIRTDNYRGGGPPNVRSEYVTRAGVQQFETPGWMNGHRVRYHFPAGIEVLDLRYRQTGFPTAFAGQFHSSDPFFDRLWQKAVRTLYITMRDNYMDCPDRERAQWWGDVVLEAGETFYALDRQSDDLTRKAILELMEWQKPDNTIYSPVPAGNWDKELPTQMLASVGYYGIWNYYLHTGDRATLARVYPRVKDYLCVWQVDEKGLVVPREGGWTWGDWGDHKDMPLLFNGWYALALKGLASMANELNDRPTRKWAEKRLARLHDAYQAAYWTGTAFRSPAHEGPTDDRGQALAVVAGLAQPEQYAAIKQVFAEQQHASPYMEKYVVEALLQMGETELALQRLKTRFTPMVASELTTLWEGWDIGSAKYGGGTYNHAWSGGGLTLLSQYVAGVAPLEPGYERVRIRPQLGTLDYVDATVPTVRGPIRVRAERGADGQVRVEYSVPDGIQVVR